MYIVINNFKVTIWRRCVNMKFSFLILYRAWWVWQFHFSYWWSMWMSKYSILFARVVLIAQLQHSIFLHCVEKILFCWNKVKVKVINFDVDASTDTKLLFRTLLIPLSALFVISFREICAHRITVLSPHEVLLPTEREFDLTLLILLDNNKSFYTVNYNVLSSVLGYLGCCNKSSYFI